MKKRIAVATLALLGATILAGCGTGPNTYCEAHPNNTSACSENRD